MRGQRNSNPGFTLLEIVLVLVVIMVIAGMVAPRLLGLAHGREVYNLADQIESLARAARAEAVAKSGTYVLNINSRAGTFWVSREDGPAGATVASAVDSEMGVQQHAPAGVLMTFISGEEGASPSKDDTSQIRFYADGRSDLGTIRLLADGMAIEINCPSETESYRIAKAGT